MLPNLASAQQALTWDQVKANFEATNPALKADADNVDEMKAEEITAFLRPNPQFSVAADGTQIAPHDGVWQPLAGHRRSAQLSATCTSATTSASCAWRAPKKARRSPQSQHEDLERNLVFALALGLCAERSRPKQCSELAKADLDYYDKIIEISRDRFKAGDLAQIDLDRIELLRVQYESELQTAIVNLRTAKIQLLQLLNDRTPVDQFDVTGPFDFSDALAAAGRFPPGCAGSAARPAGGA